MGDELMSRISRDEYPTKHFSLYRLRDSTWQCAVASNYWKTICRAAEYSAIPVPPIRASSFVSASWSCLTESTAARSHGRSSNALTRDHSVSCKKFTSFSPTLIYFGLSASYVRQRISKKRRIASGEFSLKANDGHLFMQFIYAIYLCTKSNHLRIIHH